MINYLYMLLAMIKKELLQVLMDKSSRLVLIFPPLIQSFIFGYAATFDINEVPFAFVDNDHSEISYNLRQMIKSSPYFKEIGVSGSEEELRDLLSSEKILIVVKVPSGFSKNYLSDESDQIELLADGRNSTTAGTALNYVTTMVNNYVSKNSNIKSPDIRVRYLFNENLVTKWNILPALLAVLSLIQTMMLAGLSVAREREKGTFDQILVTPLSSWQLLLGKSVPPMIVGCIQSLMILLVALFWFKIPFRGNLLSMIVLLVLFTSSVVGIGLAVSALSKNMQQAMLYVFIILVPLVLLSGLMTPISNMPIVWQYATLINPLRYAIDACRRIYLEGISLSEVYSYLIIFIAMMLITFSSAAWLFRNKLS